MLKSPFSISLLVLVLMSPLAQAATDCAAVTEIPFTECEALVALYNSTDGANWENKTGWNVTNVPCDWRGVSCSGGYVSWLNLSSNQLTGTIPSELGNLSNLTNLDLSNNQLTGEIPTELGNLTNLRYLWLQSNQLTGEIPTELGYLTSLNDLILAYNQLTGEIPSELGNLSNIGLLALSGNQLTGEIPTEMGNFSNIWLLDLSGNQLTGEIPTELFNLKKLDIFDLSSNQLCGEIPVELKNLNRQDTYFTFDNNHLTASDSEMIAWLDSYYPGWETTQTSCFGFFATPIVKVAENGGTVTITVQRNGDTSGTLEIDYATTDVSAVQGHDYIGATGTLYWAGGDSTDKSFTITINDDSNSEINETFIVTLSLRGESLDNVTIVIEDNEPVDCAVVTEISSTECEALIALYNSTGGANWHSNAGWNVTDTLCSWEGVTCSGGHVSRLYLYSNNLTGSIPTELGNLTHLTWLNLSSNKLTGSIPTELGNLSNLEELYLSSNQITDSIPTELGNLSNLNWLDLSNNELTGEIPAELGNLSNLKEFWLFDNQLIGSIPTELGNLSNLDTLILFGNQLTGSIPRELGNLTNLWALYLSNNQLTGEIPRELGNLMRLVDLMLDNNQLCGEIPVELKNLSNIGILRLDNNHLTASDSALIAWLDSRNPGWETTQTPCPIGTLQFSSTTYSVTENGGQATITVTRTGANNGAISANYATTDGTATAGNDYTQTTGTLSWADGDSADKTITIAITDDGDSEGNETFTITLTDPISGENLDNATIIITDDDTTLVTLIEFTATANESGILLEWQIATELDNAGFHLWRATGEGWKYGDYSTVIRLTEQLIAAQGDFSVYSYIDANVETGVTYYYGLEDIDLNGQSTYHWDLIDSATAR